MFKLKTTIVTRKNNSNRIVEKISQNISNILSKVLQKYQIKIVRFLDQNYIENYFEDDLSELPEMIYRIKSGQNQNEVDLVPKNTEKKGFFEKFFQLFS